MNYKKTQMNDSINSGKQYISKLGNLTKRYKLFKNTEILDIKNTTNKINAIYDIYLLNKIIQ